MINVKNKHLKKYFNVNSGKTLKIRALKLSKTALNLYTQAEYI